TPVLSIRGLCKSFGGSQALSDVDLDIMPGEVHGLLGENGSGKSTLIKVLAGFHTPDAGHLQVRGQEVHLPLAPGQFRSLGMEFVHQDLGLIPTLSVLENLRLGALSTRRGLRPIDWRSERRAATEVLARYGVHLDVARKIQELRPVEQALVAIVRGVEDMAGNLSGTGQSQGVLCLDEPTAFLPRDQVDQLFNLVHRIVETGASVIFVSHDLNEVRRITDRVTVLRNGLNVGTVQTQSTSIEELARLIIGRDLEAMATVGTRQGAGPMVLSARGLTSTALKEANFELRGGEVLGVTGLVGSGFEELPYVLFGASNVQRGEVELFGEPIDIGSMTPARAIDHGLALIPGDRQRDGSIATLSLSENMMQLSLGTYVRHGLLDRSGLRRDAAGLMDTYDIRPRQPDLGYGSFSGGNQQKALMAKWLERSPRVLLLHEPTQGVDVGARLMILELVRDAAANGAAVICASNDYEQLAMICDRVVILAQGRVTLELVGDEITKENITEQCLLSVASASGQRTANEVTT
ncbi:MAG: ribose transport system ATP-binding protein, partial [Pseudonocardiales bacterium]|nr:ribose transport system ATP-binding protein [Pseudonocardiales bacterium]